MTLRTFVVQSHTSVLRLEVPLAKNDVIILKGFFLRVYIIMCQNLDHEREF